MGRAQAAVQNDQVLNEMMNSRHLPIRACLLVLVMTLLVLGGCDRAGNEEAGSDAGPPTATQVPPEAAPEGAAAAAIAGDNQRLVVISNDEVVGHLEVSRTGSQVSIDYAVDNNGRGPKAKETVKLDERGFPLHWEIKGSSLFGAAVDEQYSWQGGNASWRSQADHGLVAAAEPGIYVGGDSSPWALELYARALLQAQGNTLAVLPSGQMRLSTLETLQLGEPAQPITIFQLSGIDLDPQLLALDANGNLFSSFGGGGGLIREGFESELSKLNEWARVHELQRMQQLRTELAHEFSQPVRYRNVRVFDSVAKTLGEPASVLIVDGKVAAIEAADAGDAAREVIVDGEGGTLLPGLYDMHAHNSMDSGLFYIASGVTSTRDMGNDDDLLAEIRRANDAGELVGPRITPNGLIEARSPYSARIGTVADSLEEALEAVRWYAENGYFEIKTYNSMNPEWVAPLYEEARRLGLGMTGHVPAFMHPDQLIEIGYDSIAHINQLMLGWLLTPEEDTRTTLRLTGLKRAAHLNLDDPRVMKTVSLMKEHGTSLDTTAVILERLMLSRAGEVPPGDHAYLSHMPIGYQRYRKRTFVPLDEPTDDAEYQAAFETLLGVVKMLYDNGVRLLPGTDDGTGFTVLRELELYVKAGIPAAATLAMASYGSAGYLGQTDTVGNIAPGQFADFFLVRGNPLEDISAVRQIRLVSRGGVVYFPEEIYRALSIEPFAPKAVVQVPGATQ
jgi:imidazolonepropionase-like amidohydrolase